MTTYIVPLMAIAPAYACVIHELWRHRLPGNSMHARDLRELHSRRRVRNNRLIIIIPQLRYCKAPYLRYLRRRNMSMRCAVHLQVHAMNAEQCQTATDPWTKPTDLSQWPACRNAENVKLLVQENVRVSGTVGATHAQETCTSNLHRIERISVLCKFIVPKSFKTQQD